MLFKKTVTLHASPSSYSMLPSHQPKITAFFIYVYLSQTLALCNENPLDSTVEIKNKESCKKHWLTDFLQTTKTQSVCIMKVKV